MAVFLAWVSIGWILLLIDSFILLNKSRLTKCLWMSKPTSLTGTGSLKVFKNFFVSQAYQ